MAREIRFEGAEIGFADRARAPFFKASTTCKAAETPDQIRVRRVPPGTFAGTTFDFALVRNGQPVACDTGGQGSE